jgi:S1-C subfamily serine protease
MGSGFIISQDGIILTNFHVLQGAYSAEVEFNNVVYDKCMFIKGDSRLDIALIKIDAKGLPALPIGDSDDIKWGEKIVVIGNPWGLERSVSDGVISGVRVKEDIQLIQMSAPVSFGSSGGPIINSYGEVIGITTLASFFTAQNLNFAIPINHLKQLIEHR